MCLCSTRHADKYCQNTIGDCVCLNAGTSILVQSPTRICLCEPGYVVEFCEKRKVEKALLFQVRWE